MCANVFLDEEKVVFSYKGSGKNIWPHAANVFPVLLRKVIDRFLRFRHFEYFTKKQEKKLVLVGC